MADGDSGGLVPGTRFGVLGPVTAWVGARRVGVGCGKPMVVLAALLLGRGDVVDRAAIIDFVWGDRPPRSAVNLVQKYVGELRRALGLGDAALAVVGTGYALRVPASVVDSAVFTDLVRRGRAARAAGDLSSAERHLGAALAHWRGVPFAGIDAPAAVAERARLDEHRVDAAELLVEIAVGFGENAAAVADLSRLVEQNPYRERLRELQVLALYRAGRRADALAVHRDVRRLLVDELGTEPGPALVRLQEQVLADDPALLGPVAERPAAVGDLSAPAAAAAVCQLPADLPDFTGRADELAEVLDAIGAEPRTCLVSGAPGVGKSTLALRAAHAARADFPDGQLHLDLAGTSDAPRPPAEVLPELLRALGVTGTSVPTSAHECAARYRSLLADRRVLLVLDDVASVAQVRPLLPPTGRSAVLLTSRQRLPDLLARHVALDVLDDRDAFRMLAGIVGQRRVATEPGDTAAVLRACGHLPLAIRIVGARLASRGTWPLAVLVQRLADSSRRISELRVGELGVRASFDLSLRLLPPAAARGFALLGLLGPEPQPGWVLGVLLGEPASEEVLDQLVDANLVRAVDTDALGRPRYRLHDLLRAYAAEAVAALPEADRRAAVSRLVATWLHLADQATDLMYTSLFRVRGPTASILPADQVRHLVRDPLAWFDTEHPTLLGAIALAADLGLAEAAWRLAAAMVPYHDHRAMLTAWHRGHELALPATRAAGDHRGEATLLRGLGQLHVYRDEFATAGAEFRRAAHLAAEVGDRLCLALAVAGLGTIARHEDRPDDAAEHAEAALRIAVAGGHGALEAQLQASLGVVRLAQGRTAEAEDFFRQALRVAHDTGDRHREATVRRHLSALHRAHGRPLRALATLRDALAIFTSLDDRNCAAHTLMALGRTYLDLGDRAPAVEALRTAVELFRGVVGEPVAQATCLRLLGELALADGNTAAARTHLTAATTLWDALPDRTEEAVATRALLAGVE
ncbi:putative regulatory protein (AfsR-like protein) [Actinokineospora spheciospongiae]|uniref:Putative regulatory protein (AfsR-like protein) n=1 Tax=Actinokineospora spheciospongiae TaxID=909613 RepID=W7J3U0_9PSEU|nr:BTAD domain-containing putative transcriptional regulator [Actinokineospora spheciospongiae]EWC60799.1 putative regulatory protein (AfsR-like protein) [Actinokineospora spheciospongiae]